LAILNPKNSESIHFSIQKFTFNHFSIQKLTIDSFFNQKTHNRFIFSIQQTRIRLFSIQKTRIQFIFNPKNLSVFESKNQNSLPNFNSKKSKQKTHIINWKAEIKG
jgi:hypothetical protein